MFNTQTLRDISNELATVVDLTGNCGRQVRRMLERHFVVQNDGTAVRRFPLFANINELLFSYAIQKAQLHASAISEAIHGFSREGEITAKIVDIDVVARTFSLQLTMFGIDGTVRTRQDRLTSVIHALQIVATALDALPTSKVEVLNDLFTYDNSQRHDERNTRYLNLFNKLVANEFDELGTTPLVLLSLAGLLNPEVEKASLAYDAAHPLVSTPAVM